MAVNKIILDDINKIDNLSILSNTKLLTVLNTVIKNEKNLYAQLIEIVDFLNTTYFGESNSDNFITRPINGKVSSVSITNGKLIVSYYYEGAIHNVIYRLDIESSQHVDPEPFDPDVDPTPVPGYDTKPGSKVTILTQFIPEGDISILQPGEVGDYAYADGTIYVWKNDMWTEVTDAYGLYLYNNDIYKYDEGVMTVVLEGANKTPIITTLTRWENYMPDLVLQGNTVGDYAYIVNGVYVWNGTAWVTPTNYDYPLYYVWNNDLYELYETNKIKVVIKGDTKEVYHCIKFGGSAPSQVTNGAYIMTSDNHADDYEGDNCKIYKGENDSWSLLGSPTSNTTYIDCENKIIYYWDGTQFKTIANYSVGGGGVSIDIDTTISDPNSTHIPTVKAVTGYVDNKIANITVDDSIGWGEPDFNDPMRPEYYLEIDGELVRNDEEKQAQVKWGIDLYNWPIRCFNGTVDDIDIEGTFSGTKFTPTVYNGVVFAPSERIISNLGISYSFTSANVYYYLTGSYFVLKVVDNGETKYYSKWTNSHEWNNQLAMGARRDCVYSDISLEDDPNIAGTQGTSTDYRPVTTLQAKRISYVWGYSEGTPELERIDTLMTDFTKAVRDCLVENTLKKKGDMHLSDRIYYVGEYGKITSSYRTAHDSSMKCIIHNSNLYDAKSRWIIHDADYDRDYIFLQALDNNSGFTIDGGNGTLFIRSYANGVPLQKNASFCTVFNLSSSNNCTIKNIKIKTLRDKDNGVDAYIGTNPPLSSSDSYLRCFRFGSSSTNINIVNVSIQGFNMDMEARSSNPTNILFKNYTAIDGWQNHICGRNIVFDNCKIVQRPFAGVGMHIFYNQTSGTSVVDVKFIDCLLKQADGYGSVAYTCHGITTSSRNYFERCKLEGGYFFSGDQADNRFEFKDCTFIKNQTTSVYSTGVGVSNYFIAEEGANWRLHGCKVLLYRGYLFGSGNAGGIPKRYIQLKDCEVYTTMPNEGSIVRYNKPSPNAYTYSVGWESYDNVVTNFVNRPAGTIYEENAIFSIYNIVNSYGNNLTNLQKSNASDVAPDIDEVPEGFFYFDTTDGKPYWKAKTGSNPDTYGWVDATGTPILTGQTVENPTI